MRTRQLRRARGMARLVLLPVSYRRCNKALVGLLVPNRKVRPMTVQPGDPMHCPKQARRTPMIPTHNGHSRCVRCGVEVPPLIFAQVRVNREREGAES